MNLFSTKFSSEKRESLLIFFQHITKIILFCFLLQSCQNDTNRNKDSEKDINTGNTIENQTKARNSLRSINFYLENSGSMDPYTKGSTDFNRTLNTLLRDIDLLPLDTVKLFAANTKIYPLNQDLDAFINYLYNKGIPSEGDTNNSDLHLIFQNLLDGHENGSVSILVTDAIYSVEGTREKLLGNLEQKALKTRNYFYKTLQEKDFATLTLKMDSEYNGFYYPAVGGRIEINQKRPYYIWFFGDGKLLKEFSEKLKLYNLPGYQDFVYSVKNSNEPIAYSIVEHSVGDIGNFKNTNRGSYPVHSIQDAEEAGRGENRGQFGFAVAVDFSETPLPNNHLLDISNYNVTSDEYELYNIKAIDSGLDDKAKDYLKIVEKSLEGTNFTHLLFLKTDKKFLQTFEVELKNEIPNWINKTGINDDTEIVGDTQHTFGFDKLIGGILKAYDEVNKGENIYSIRLTVK